MAISQANKPLLLILATVFLFLRFVHLDADYPRNIRWDDGIATDEGWYASAAVNEQTWGIGTLPGDMNIPILMPVWSAIAETAFRVGGFHVICLRVTAILFFALCLVLSCLLLRRYGAGEWIPFFAAMLAVNPWSFAFSRSGFLEFPMLSLCLLAILLGHGSFSRGGRRIKGRGVAMLFAAGAIFAAAALLKTTAVVLTPVLAYTLLEASGFRLRPALRSMGIVFGFAAVIYGIYWQIYVRPQMTEINFYLSVVKNTLRFTPYGFIADSSRPFRYGAGSEHLLFPVSLLTVFLSFVVSKWRVLWRDPLFALPAVWIISFMGFLIKHNNDPARSFAIVIPAVLLLTVALLRNTMWSSERVRQVLLGLIVLDLCGNAVQISAAILHPAYSFRDACLAVGSIVSKESGQNAAVVGDNAHEVALQSGLRPVNLLFHSASITAQMDRRQPGWWLQFAPIEDGRCFREVLSHAYTADYRGEWTIFYRGQRLVLWKLTKIPGATLPAELTPEQTAACSPPVYN